MEKARVARVSEGCCKMATVTTTFGASDDVGFGAESGS